MAGKRLDAGHGKARTQAAGVLPHRHAARCTRRPRTHERAHTFTHIYAQRERARWGEEASRDGCARGGRRGDLGSIVAAKEVIAAHATAEAVVRRLDCVEVVEQQARQR